MIKMALINYTEKSVHEHLKEYLQLHPGQFCTCDQCLEDITAYALNRLPPRYVTTHKGEVITDFCLSEPFDRTKVLTEVIRAINAVSKNPSHP